jgi:hypothetical protein
MVNVSVPDFKLHKHKSNSILASDQIDHLSLKKMVKAVKLDEKILQNLAEPLLDGHIELDSNIAGCKWLFRTYFYYFRRHFFHGFYLYVCNLDPYKLHLWLYNKFKMYTVTLLLFLKHQQQPRTVQFLIQNC